MRYVAIKSECWYTVYGTAISRQAVGSSRNTLEPVQASRILHDERSLYGFGNNQGDTGSCLKGTGLHHRDSPVQKLFSYE